MGAILPIVAGTPPWVWALLVLLLVIGIRALRPATTPLWRAAILPTVFLVWGLSGVLARGGFTPRSVLAWAVALAAGAALGALLAGLQPVRIDRTRSVIEFPGTPIPLVLILLIFATKYAFGVLHAIRPDLFAAGLGLAELAVSGMLTGMFVGRFAHLWWLYRAAPAASLPA